MKFAGIAAVVIATTLVTGAASAATLSLVGPFETDTGVTGNDFGYNGSLDYISGDKKTLANGLSLDGPAKVTYTYLGKEAKNKNFVANIGGTFFTTFGTVAGATKIVTQAAAGFLDFAFGTSSPSSAISLIANNGLANPSKITYAIAYYKLSDTSYLALFDDIAKGDRDFDDIGVRIDVEDLAPVPVPAAGFLLLGAMGGLGAFARKRRATV